MKVKLKKRNPKEFVKEYGMWGWGMSEPKKYHEMSREERIADSDKATIRELEKELRKKIKQQYDVLKTLETIIKKWVKK